MNDNYKIIAFDADDTLWENEIFFREAEKEFCELFPETEYSNVLDSLVKTIIKNLEIYGYGIKGFVLSMVETAINLNSQSKISNALEIGKKMLNKPVVLIDGVIEILNTLKARQYKLVLATKGDLFDQQRKLTKSNLLSFFDHVEVMSQKKEEDYLRLISILGIQANEFLMIGNSLKSDIIPVINIGGMAVHIPHPQLWVHERVDKNELQENYIEVKSIANLIELIK